MKQFVVTTKRLIVTKYVVEADNQFEAEEIVNNLESRELDDHDRWRGDCISMDIETDTNPLKEEINEKWVIRKK